MNTLYLFIEIIVCFSAVVIAAKVFGKYGLIGWIGVASVLANIITAKTSNILGLDAAQGTVLLARNTAKKRQNAAFYSVCSHR